MARSTIVTDDQVREMDEGLATLKTVDEEIRLAKLAGVDVSEAEKRAADARQQLTRMRNTYKAGSV